MQETRSFQLPTLRGIGGRKYGALLCWSRLLTLYCASSCSLPVEHSDLSILPRFKIFRESFNLHQHFTGYPCQNSLRQLLSIFLFARLPLLATMADNNDEQYMEAFKQDPIPTYENNYLKAINPAVLQFKPDSVSSAAAEQQEQPACDEQSWLAQSSASDPGSSAQCVFFFVHAKS